MSKNPADRPRGDEVERRDGELRKAGDRHSQPGQGADLTPPNAGTMNPLNDRAARRELDPARRPDVPPGDESL